MHKTQQLRYKQRFHVSDDNWKGLESSKVLDDDAILETLFHYSSNCRLENPFYKFIEILHQVEKRDKVFIEDLESLDKYYNMGLVNKLLTKPGISEYYIGGAFREKEMLARYLKGNYSRFDYIGFHNFLSGLY